MAEDGMQRRPRRIILVRHGQSEGNVDPKIYCTSADPTIRLTATGAQQSEHCGQKIRKIIEQSCKGGDWCVHFYVSPYQRTLSTLKGIGRAFGKEHIVGVREEPRIREQDFGNFQHDESMKRSNEIRKEFGRFFYRFPEGESVADVFDRVTRIWKNDETAKRFHVLIQFYLSFFSFHLSLTYCLRLIESTFNAGFLESLWRDIDMNRLNRHTKSKEINLVIVSHGVTMRVFLMRWFKWTTQQFEKLHNPSNCEVRVMELGEGGEYSLLVHHTKEELEEWGLTPDMIKDQECRKTAKRGQWSDHWAWSGTDFFDHFEDNVDHRIEAKGEERFSDVDSGKQNLVNGNGNRCTNDDDLTPLDMIS